MAERPIVMTQVVECKIPSMYSGHPLGRWTKSIEAEGMGGQETTARLEQEVDRYFDKQDDRLPPTPLYYALFGCRKRGAPTIERKLTLFDSIRRFCLRIGA